MLAELNTAKLEDRQATLLRIRRDFKYPVDLIPIADLPLSLRARVTRSNERIHSLRLANRGEFVVAALQDGQQAIRFGPFPDYSGIAIEDSLSGWMQLAVDKINNAANARSACGEMQPIFDFPVVVVERHDVPLEARKRIENGREVVFYTPDGEQYFAASALTKSNDFLRLGPFPSFERIDKKAAATTLAFVLLPAAVAIALLLRPISSQLRQVENAAKQIAAGELSARVDERRTGAARTLALAFNNMASRTEKLVESQRELLQAVSHELRTPLSRIRFAIELIETAKDESERAQRLKSLETASEELDELVAELLRYVRLETTQSNLQREPISVSEILELLVHKARDFRPSIQIDYRPTDSAVECYVEVDRQEFQRAIGNLLSNAVRHARERVTIGAQIVDSELIIDVDDDGKGIPEGDRERVLEPFVRLDNLAEGEHRGVGLGLALVKRIVRNHNAYILIQSSPLGGCRVRTTWPKHVAIT